MLESALLLKSALLLETTLLLEATLLRTETSSPGLLRIAALLLKSTLLETALLLEPSLLREALLLKTTLRLETTLPLSCRHGVVRIGRVPYQTEKADALAVALRTAERLGRLLYVIATLGTLERFHGSCFTKLLLLKEVVLANPETTEANHHRFGTITAIHGIVRHAIRQRTSTKALAYTEPLLRKTTQPFTRTTSTPRESDV